MTSPIHRAAEPWRGSCRRRLLAVIALWTSELLLAAPVAGQGLALVSPEEYDRIPVASPPLAFTALPSRTDISEYLPRPRSQRTAGVVCGLGRRGALRHSNAIGAGTPSRPRIEPRPACGRQRRFAGLSFRLEGDACYVLAAEGYDRTNDTGPYTLRFRGRVSYPYVTHGQGEWSPWTAWASPARR